MVDRVGALRSPVQHDFSLLRDELDLGPWLEAKSFAERQRDRDLALTCNLHAQVIPDSVHLYLMDGKTGKKIGPLEEVQDMLDTAADAFIAEWSADSRQVAITYRIERRESATIRYRIENGRARRLSGPGKEE